MQGLVEAMGRIVWGEPVRVVRQSEWDRVSRLAYREQLQDAAKRGDEAFIQAEIDKNQLTESDLRRLAHQHTGVENWPDSGEDLLAPDAFDSEHRTDSRESAGSL